MFLFPVKALWRTVTFLHICVEDKLVIMSQLQVLLLSFILLNWVDIFSCSLNSSPDHDVLSIIIEKGRILEMTMFSAL